MSFAPKTPFGVVPAASAAGIGSAPSGAPGSVGARRASSSASSTPSKYSRGWRGRPECASRSKNSCGRPATPVPSSSAHSSVLPLRGVAHTRHDFITFPIGLGDNVRVRPNILYVHSHDTGRYVQPYGHPVPTPNIQRLADQGLLFRQAFCAAPTCSGSRASLLTGQWTHSNGMMGLAHRGFELYDYGHHLVRTLRDAGYWTGLIGEQHLSRDPDVLGYDHVVDIDNHLVDAVAPAALRLITERPSEPFFLSIGFFETHREYFEPTSVRDSLYSLPPANLPDTAATRRDMASYKASARSLDHGVGAVLNALDENDLADDTIVILTTDHGLAFPGAKATLTDRGLGVMLIVRGPGGFHGGKVSEALVSQIDLFPTLCELTGIPAPGWLQGRSLLPLVRRETDEVNDAIFAELTFHAAYEPQRSIRTQRHKYIRRFGDRLTPVLPNVDDGPTKELLIASGWADRPLPREELHDLLFDPAEAANVAEDPAYSEVRAELAGRLEAWMRETADPLLEGDVEPPPGAEITDPDQLSPAGAPVAHR
ncbi:MAG TPA: sulfatase [Solirubrobacteraceae bacterium]|nr:sulfatase [Solirubrobacteraceae bacterium]